MTNEEAIEELKERYLGMSAYSDREQFQKANQALDMAIEALEKQIPKPPTKTKNSTLLCPNCGEYVGYVDAEVDIRTDYCNFCGQAIDWRFI